MLIRIRQQMDDLARLRATLGTPELVWLIERLRGCLERQRALPASVILDCPTAQQRRAVDCLLGRPPSRGKSLRVDLGRLDRLLRRAGLCADLEQAAEALGGPLSGRFALRARRAASWSSLFAEVGRRLEGQSVRNWPAQHWLAELQASGLLKRLSGGDPQLGQRLLEQALLVLDHLPGAGQLLAEIAATVTGDSHVLDAGRPLSTLVLRALPHLWDVDRDAERRDAWAAVGVLCDELSAPVLTLNLRAAIEGTSGRALALHAAAGEPYRLSIRQLRRQPPHFSVRRTGRRVFVCENPAVVAAAADRLGASSAPLICLEGQPTTAARLLLEQLSAAHIELVYHGDFDWPGLHIGNLVRRRHGAAPWRFSAVDYLSTRGGSELAGLAVVASWDTELAPAMEAEQRAVHEEQMLAELLTDLARGEVSGAG